MAVTGEIYEHISWLYAHGRLPSFFSPLDPLLNHSVVKNLHIHKYTDSRHTYRLSETFTTTSAYTGKGIYCTIVTNTQTHKHTNTQTHQQGDVHNTHKKQKDHQRWSSNALHTAYTSETSCTAYIARNACTAHTVAYLPLHTYIAIWLI